MDIPIIGEELAGQISDIAAGLNAAEVPFGNPAGMVADLQSAGWSEDSAFQLVGDLGVSVSRDSFASVWGQVAADAANRDALGGIGFDSTVPREFHSPWSAGQPGRFAYQSEGYVWETVTNPDGSTSTFLNTFHNTTFSSTPLSKDEVLADLEDNAEQAINQYPQFATYIGGFVTAAYFTVGRTA